MGLTPRPPKWGTGQRMLVSLSGTVRLVLGLLEKPLGEQTAGVKTCWEDADAGRKPTQDRERVGGGAERCSLHPSLQQVGEKKGSFQSPSPASQAEHRG